MSPAVHESVSFVSRYLSSPTRRTSARMPFINSPKKRQNTTVARSSKVLSALDAMELRQEEEETDSEIEVFGPFPVPEKAASKRTGMGSRESQARSDATSKSKLKSLHPLFMQKSTPPVSNDSSAIKKGKKSASPAEYVLSIDAMAEMMSPDTITTHISMDAVITTSKLKGTLKGKDKEVQAKPDTTLPKYTYKDYDNPKPYLVFTKDESEADDLVAGLKHGPMALDLEWRVFFSRSGQSQSTKLVERRTAVVQVADTRGVMLVVQVYGMERFPKKLQALIEDPTIPKLGVNILSDGKKLFRDHGILAKNLVELGAVARVADPMGAKWKRKIVSLAKLVEQYCGKILEKGHERTGNWEGDLGERQLEYAANDVHSSIMIYTRLLEIAKERAIILGDSSTIFSSNVEVLAEASPVSRSSSTSTSSTVTGTETQTADSLEFPTDIANIPFDNVAPPPQMRPQHLRAYRYWHEKGMSVEAMCVALSLKGKVAEGKLGEALKTSTVISYIVGALQADPKLPFEMWKLRELVQSDGASWVRHREWILSVWGERRGTTADEH
ncbi:Werner Syndrome-like exonuclease [Hypsizygus marmoreus]|uniref:Werner Syndrome-like exonuclease n=1 Tax=Hypsizygus marmoreus TaxID=39966 RepID=A0A369KBB6_HYPMA|nr:Werner Syndrome-like exonuclease [Hypsizygus marmoreus]